MMRWKMGRNLRITVNTFLRIMMMLMLIMGSISIAGAFEIPTGNDDVRFNWDTTFRYNFGLRTLKPDPAIIGNPNLDDGDRNFAHGTVTNRLDVIPEIDFTYKGRYGARVVGAFWYDQRYDDPLHNDSVATSNHLENGQQAIGLSDYTKNYHRGPYGELLDAFVFGGVDLGPVPVDMKVGRHTIYWGESLFLGGALNAISYSQMPIDAAKGFATPGSEAKELFRPLFNISFLAQILTNVSIAGQYFLEWDHYRLPEAGSYLNNADVLLAGGESLILAPGVLFTHGNDQQPSGKENWGISARWRAEWLNGGILGLFYRRYTDMLPQLHVDLAAGQYFVAYANHIDLYGISLSKEILGVSVGAELSYRQDTPLVSEAVVMVPGTPRPGDGETLGARGDTFHGLINFLGLLSKNRLWDAAQWATEFTWAYWNRVSQGEQYFLGRGGYNNIDSVDRNAVGFAASFTPTWYQVFPSMDLSMPLSYYRGLIGNSPLLFGDNENAGNFSAGFTLDVHQKYNFNIQYVGFFGDYDTGPDGAVTFNRGTYATLSDRDMVTFTFKVTF
jgi:hypothetical protein